MIKVEAVPLYTYHSFLTEHKPNQRDINRTLAQEDWKESAYIEERTTCTRKRREIYIKTQIYEQERNIYLNHATGLSSFSTFHHMINNANINQKNKQKKKKSDF